MEMPDDVKELLDYRLRNYYNQALWLDWFFELYNKYIARNRMEHMTDKNCHSCRLRVVAGLKKLIDFKL